MFLGYGHVGHMLFCESNGKFDDKKLSKDVTDEPSFVDSFFDELRGFLQFRDFRSILASFLSRRPKTFQAAFAALIASLPPPGNGPLGPWFRLLPPQLREHLQDRYIAALTPGATQIRSDIE